MLLTLEALNAEEGDCLLLHHGSPSEPSHILIDGGPGATWARSLEPRLRELRELHALDDGDPLAVDLAVLTHTDADHIDGMVAMFEQLRRLNERKQPLPYRIDHLWFNSFDDRPGNREAASIQSLAQSALPEVRAFVASTKMGQALRNAARGLGIPVNRQFADIPRRREWAHEPFAMRTEAGVPQIEIDDLTFTVLSPTKAELEAFERNWDQYLVAQRDKKAGGAAAMGDDRSPTNLSSIVLLAERGDKRLLLTGDAKASEILAGLDAAGVLGEREPLSVDLLKVPHHLSLHNSTRDLYERVHAKHYVISANGKHGNPDRPALDMLWNARGGRKAADWDLWVTFPRNAYRRIDPDAAATRAERAGLEERRDALTEIQAWFDAHPIKVHYRKPDALSVRIDLGDEALNDA